MTFAIAAVPLILAAGAGVDYSAASVQRSKALGALDSAVLAVARTGTADSALGNTVFQSNLGDPGAVATFAMSPEASGAKVFTAEATISSKTTFARILGISELTMTIRSEAVATAAAPKIVSVTFTPTRVQGAYSKDIFFFTRDASGKIASLQTSVTYRYNGNTGAKTVSPALNLSSMTFTVPDYVTFGVGMTVYEDWKDLSGALINPVKKYSDQADAATFIKRAGACSDMAGEAVQMEDGGDANFLDFHYTMKCTVSATGAAVSSVYLRR